MRLLHARMAICICIYLHVMCSSRAEQSRAEVLIDEYIVMRFIPDRSEGMPSDPATMIEGEGEAGERR
ncbi:hypothetical protein M758_3G067500 [Ceratodon purpureus]|nr:hypothetical protein M758_3G067500 [Ceratodon purpureus]